MSAAKRRQRRRREGSGGATQVMEAPPQGQPRQDAGPTIVPMPPWKWRTFPVFFAFALGLFLGSWAGGLSGFVSADSGNNLPLNVVYVVSAIFMGLALSRLMTRWMISKQWVRPRAKKKRR